jgi:hypothetical protein
MPTVTVTQPNVIRVKIESQQTRVSTINYAATTLKNDSDVDMTGALTGDVLVYDDNTQIFSARRIGSSTPVSGSLIPTSTRTADLGSTTRRFRSLFLSGNTIDLDGTTMKADDNTGAIAFSAAPTANNPNPIAIVVSPVGGFVPVQTVGGQISNTAIAQAVANSVTYVAFQGADSGFF